MKMDAAAFVADPGLVQALKVHSTPVACEQERVLFNQGDAPDGLYIFHKGKLRLVMRSQLGDTLMNIPAIEGSLLGLPGLIGGTPYSLSACAEKGSEVSYVSREEFARGAHGAHGAGRGVDNQFSAIRPAATRSRSWIGSLNSIHSDFDGRTALLAGGEFPCKVLLNHRNTVHTGSGKTDLCQVVAIAPHAEPETSARLNVLAGFRLDQDDAPVSPGCAIAEAEKAVRQQLKRVVSGGQRLVICRKRERDMNGCLGLACSAGPSQEQPGCHYCQKQMSDGRKAAVHRSPSNSDSVPVVVLTGLQRPSPCTRIEQRSMHWKSF